MATSNAPSLERAPYGESWVWVNNVIFGMVATRGFIQLIQNAQSENYQFEARIAFFAIAAYGFLLYDITVYQWLAHRYPFRYTHRSALRLGIDTLMAFLVAIVVLSLTADNPVAHEKLVLGSLAGWHALALSWHVLAHQERNGEFPSLGQIGPHLVAVAYLLPLLAAPVKSSEAVLLAAAALLLLFSVTRSGQAISEMRARDGRRALERALAGLDERQRLDLAREIGRLSLDVEHFDEYRTARAAEKWLAANPSNVSSPVHDDVVRALAPYLEKR